MPKFLWFFESRTLIGAALKEHLITPNVPGWGLGLGEIDHTYEVDSLNERFWWFFFIAKIVNISRKFRYKTYW